LSYEIEFLDPAVEEFEEAISWYEDKKIGLGFEFANDIEDYLILIESNPYLLEKHQNRDNLHKVPCFVFFIQLFIGLTNMKK
jgi:hypothetical protein